MTNLLFRFVGRRLRERQTDLYCLWILADDLLGLCVERLDPSPPDPEEIDLRDNVVALHPAVTGRV